MTESIALTEPMALELCLGVNCNCTHPRRTIWEVLGRANWRERARTVNMMKMNYLDQLPYTVNVVLLVDGSWMYAPARPFVYLLLD